MVLFKWLLEEQDSVWCGGLVDCWSKVHSSSVGFDPVIVGVKALLGEVRVCWLCCVTCFVGVCFVGLEYCCVVLLFLCARFCVVDSLDWVIILLSD